MQQTIKPFLFHTLIFTISFAVIACTIPNPTKKLDTKATTFKIATQTAKFTKSEMQEKISIPKSKTLQFLICMQTIGKSIPIKNQLFLVSDAVNSQQLNTDATGCLSWAEEIAYNPLAADENIKIDKNITSLGTENGSASLSLTANPWSEAINSQDVLANESMQKLPQLQLDNTVSDVHTNSDKKIIISLKSEVWLNIPSGKLKLTVAKFKVKLSLYKKATNEYFDSAEFETEIKDDLISLQAELKSPENCNSGDIYYQLELTPIDAPEDIQPAKELHQLQAC